MEVVSVLTSLFVGLLILVIWKFFGADRKVEETEDEAAAGDSVQEVKKKNEPKRTKAKSNKPIKAPVFTHDLLLTTLKGHSSSVLCLESSLNGKYLASCSDDQTIRLWSVKDFGSGNKSVRVNVEYDHAQLIRFSPDNRAFIAGLTNFCRVYRLGKKDDGVTTTCRPLDDDFPPYKSAKLLNIGVGTSPSGGSFVMTSYRDTAILIRDLRGSVLHTINTNQGNNNCSWVSPCGRLVASSGWTPDVKVWAVNFTRNGEFKDVKDAFVLEGHKSSVWSFAFNLDSSRMLTISKDGFWRLFDTDVNYVQGQDPSLVNKGELTIGGLSPKENVCVAALSSNGLVAAIACSDNLIVFSTRTGEVELEALKVHSEEISSITFDIGGRYIISTGDKHIRVFHNTLNYKEKINAIELSLAKGKQSSAMRERQQKELATLEKALDKIYDGQKKN